MGPAVAGARMKRFTVSTGPKKTLTRGSQWRTTKEDRPRPTSLNWTRPTFYTGQCASRLIYVIRDSSKKTSEEHSDSAAALIHESKKGRKKTRRGPYCAPGKHNPEAIGHDADHCWQLHPELRPASYNKGNSSGSGPPQAATTQLVEVDEGHESEVSLLLTEAASKPVVLDSGATHHLVNNPDVFIPSAKSTTRISTGGHKNFLYATAMVMMPNSNIEECNICKECKLKALPFSGTFRPADDQKKG
ncbi:hypothetical protein VP01_448g8 [Puccinia sorghi]|uniref:Uncharacterized protein n=1 Tax=Puccinia sorghi TaxID=27349 RepID=A0A0L6UQ16_9BASI|nr:hypothetical protein VP01_448g8 [Puccinia sorghi]